MILRISRVAVSVASLLILAVSVTLLLALTVSASLGTVFSRDGWGWWYDEGDPASRGRGGTSVAVTDYGGCGEVNPSAVALTGLSYGYVSYAGELFDVKGRDGTYRQREDALPHLGGVIVLPRGLRACALLRAQTDASFERMERIGGDPISAGRLRTRGQGGWNRLQFGLAGPGFRSRLLWGLSVARIVGTVKEEHLYDFDDSSARDVRQVVEGRLGGAWAGTGGFVLRPDPHIALGAALTLAGSSRIVQEVRVLEGTSFEESKRGRQELPDQWAVGIQSKPVARTSLSADIVRTLWGSAALCPVLSEAARYPYHDSIRWGVGFEHALGPVAEPAWILRGGYAHSISYVRAMDGSRVVERGFSLGIRRRAAKGRAAIDAALELGKRGDQDKLGVEERFARFTLGLTFSSVVREY